MAKSQAQAGKKGGQPVASKEKPQGTGSVGSHKPGGDGRGNKKVHEDHDDRKTRK